MVFYGKRDILPGRRYAYAVSILFQIPAAVVLHLVVQLVSSDVDGFCDTWKARQRLRAWAQFQFIYVQYAVLFFVVLDGIGCFAAFGVESLYCIRALSFACSKRNWCAYRQDQRGQFLDHVIPSVVCDYQQTISCTVRWSCLCGLVPSFAVHVARIEYALVVLDDLKCDVGLAGSGRGRLRTWLPLSSIRPGWQASTHFRVAPDFPCVSHIRLFWWCRRAASGWARGRRCSVSGSGWAACR